MPERHRGAHPQDAESFAEEQLAKLRTAAGELGWLVSRGYAVGAASGLVGDHHQLTSRQRQAVSRVVCSDEQLAERRAKALSLSQLKGQTLLIDGFNLLITIETALGGGVLFRSRDGCCRDLSSVYGSYKVVAETREAIELIGRTLAKASPEKVRWLFDRPVSNSGRVAGLVRDIAELHGWPFEAELTDRTDSLLCQSSDVIISCDSAILERTAQWCSLACVIIEEQLPESRLLELL